jgi:hypothetical protein
MSKAPGRPDNYWLSSISDNSFGGAEVSIGRTLKDFELSFHLIG